MENLQRTNDQHTVPESYLKLFIKLDQLYTLDILKVKKGWKELPKKMSPGGICYTRDYYTIKEEYPENYFKLKDHDSHFVEDKVLTSLENKYPHLFKQLTESRKMSLAEAIDLSDFMTTLKIRNPYWFEKVIQKNISAWAERLLPELIEKSKNIDPCAGRLPDWAFEFITSTLKQSQQADVNYAKQFQLYSLIERYIDHRDRNKLLREKVIDCVWNLYISPEEGPYFITTDNPGSAIGTIDKLYHTIKLDGGFIFYFPLSYRYTLVLSDWDKDCAFTNRMPQKEIYPVQVNSKQVNRVNDTVIQVASKLLIAADATYLTAITQLNKPK